MTETTFTLVRTTNDRGGDNDDYDVCDGDKVIGRIVRDPLAPMEAPWFDISSCTPRVRCHHVNKGRRITVPVSGTAPTTMR
jgi:hypothetical protein